MRKTSTQSTPILLPPAAGESLVYCTPFNRVIALDPGSGSSAGSSTRISTDAVIALSAAAGSVTRGNARQRRRPCRHRLYLGTHDRKLWAIDATDGKPCEDFGDAGKVLLYGAEGYVPGDVSNSSAPVVANGVVVVGSTVIDFVRATTPRGTVQAFDSFSGAPLWQFDPLLGYANSGSANVWAPMSVDEENGLLYLPTSAASPDYYGAQRAGRRPVCQQYRRPGSAQRRSALALPARASRPVGLRHPGTTHSVAWNKNGEKIPALAQLTKQGFVFVFNRLTGESLWEITEQPVPPSQIPGEQASPPNPNPSRHHNCSTPS